MDNHDVPPGWGRNPSGLSHRLPVLIVALAGLGIATYLALYQVGVVKDVWEPFFGNGSKLLLKQSSIAHLLPIPDAALGAFAYLLEIVTDAAGGRARWRTAPWLVLAFGAVAFALGITGVLLVILQPTLFGAFCTLCLCSAVCSVTAAALAAPEVVAAVRRLREVAARRSHERAPGGRHARP